MSWLTNYVLPKIRALTRKDVPDNLWRKCPSCEQMLFHRDLTQSLEVCHHCGHHFRIGSEARFKILFDDAVFEKIEAPKVPPDPLRFRDRKRYTERLREGQTALGAGSDAVAIAQGRIGGQPAVVLAFDFAFMGGSMGVAAGEAMLTAARRAVERQAALIAVPASGGARMQEGILSLMQMPRTILAAEVVKEGGAPPPSSSGPARRRAASRHPSRASAISPWPSPARSSALPVRGSSKRRSERSCPKGFSAPNISMSTAWSTRSCRAANCTRPSRASSPCCASRCARWPSFRRRSRKPRSSPDARQRPGVAAPDGAAPEKDRPLARPHRAPARRARQPAGPAPAGCACRRHKRKRLDRRDIARLSRSRRG